MRLTASLYALLCAATMAWLTLCKVFERTYFRPVAKVLDGSPVPYDTAVDCGIRLMGDIFLPSIFTLALSFVLAICVAVRKGESAPARTP